MAGYFGRWPTQQYKTKLALRVYLKNISTEFWTYLTIIATLLIFWKHQKKHSKNSKKGRFFRFVDIIDLAGNGQMAEQVYKTKLALRIGPQNLHNKFYRHGKRIAAVLWFLDPPPIMAIIGGGVADLKMSIVAAMS